MTRNARNEGEQHCLRRTATAGVVLVALALAVGVAGTGTAAAQQDITACDAILGAGSYEITQDIDEPNTANCVNVQADDVVIEGNGNTINGTGTGVSVQPNPGFGFDAPVSNVTVRNLTVTNSVTGVSFEDAEDGEVVDVGVASANTGVSVENGTDMVVEGATVSDVDVGVRSNGSTNVTVRDSFVTSVEILDIDPIPDPIPDPVLGTQQTPSADTGIFFSNTKDGKIVDNTVTEFDGPGVNVLSSEPSDITIPDPIPDPVPDPDPVLSNDGTAPAQLFANEVVGNEVRRNENGIVFEESSGYEVADNTVTNNTRTGIAVAASSSISLTENTVNENGEHGAWLLEASTLNTLSDNVAEDNDRAGIYLGGVSTTVPVDNNTLVNNTARRNEYGIWLNNAFDNDVSESLAENNAEGIAVEEESLIITEGVETESVGSSGNTFTDDVSRNNDWDFVVESLDIAPISTSATSPDFPVTNLSIGASTSPDTTLSFNADDVRLRSVDSPEPDPDALENVGRYFEAEQTSLDAFLNVSLSYDDSDVSGVNESTLELQRFASTEWVSVAGSSVDTSENLVSANATTFSDFGAFGESEQGGGGGFDLDDYRNQNGNVDTAGLQRAINDFIQNNIDTGDLQAVINAFISSS